MALLDDTDTALARSKMGSRNQVTVFDDIILDCGRVLEHDAQNEIALALPVDRMRPIAIPPGVHLSHHTLDNLGGVCYSKLSRFDQAMDCYEMAIRQSPRDVMYRGNLDIVAYRTGQHERVLTWLNAMDDALACCGHALRPIKEEQTEPLRLIALDQHAVVSGGNARVIGTAGHAREYAYPEIHAFV